MAFTLYDASVPVFARGLQTLSGLLDKGAAALPEAELLAGRLAPDMHPLPRQVQIASDTAKGVVARLAGIDAPAMADTETTVAELKERIGATLRFIHGVDRALIDGHEDRETVMKLPSGDLRMPAGQHLTGFGLPNFWFHVTTAYAIMRHLGVGVGKMDFLGGR